MPKKSDVPNEKVKKASENLYDIKIPSVTTIGMVDKEGTIQTVDKKGNQDLMWWRKSSLLLFQKNKN